MKTLYFKNTATKEVTMILESKESIRELVYSGWKQVTVKEYDKAYLNKVLK